MDRTDRRTDPPGTDRPRIDRPRIDRRRVRAPRVLAACLVLLLGALAPATGRTQDLPADDGAPRMTLAAAVGLALRNNRSIRTAQVAREAQKFAVTVQESLLGPQASISAATAATRTRQSAFGATDASARELASVIDQLDYAASVAPSVSLQTPFGTSYTLQLNNAFARTWDLSDGGTADDRRFTVNPELTIVQPLLRGLGRGVNTANLEIARLNEELGRLALRDTVAGVVTSVITAYWQVVLTREQLEIGRLALERARQLRTINRTLIDTGRMAEVEIVQTEADVAEQEFGVAVAENAYEQAKLELLALLDLPDFIDFAPQRIGAIEPVDIALDDALDRALAARREIVAASIDLALADIGMLLAQDGRKWDLNVVGSAGSSSSRRYVGDAVRGLGRDDYSLSIGLELVIPINDRSLEAAVVDARRDVETARLAQSETEQSVRIEVQNAVRDVASTFRQVQLAENARVLAERQLAIEQEKLSLGRSSNFEVLRFQDTLRSSRLDEVSARVAYLNAAAALDLALGSTLETWQIEVTDDAARMEFGAGANAGAGAGVAPGGLALPPGYRDGAPPLPVPLPE